MSKPPVCWNSFVFRFHLSDDRDDLYSGDGFDGRLRYSRSLKLWCASLHGASAVWEAGGDGAADHQGARLALEAAVVALRGRIAADQQLLGRLAKEVGCFWCRECVDFVAVPEVVGYCPRLPPEGLDLDRWVEGLRLSLTDQALERAGGNKAHAARLLGLKRTALLMRLKAWARAGVALA